MSETATEDTAGVTGEANGQGADSAGHEGDQGAGGASSEATEPTAEELARDRDHWKSTAQRHEKTARENSKAAAKLREIEDANKSELQKANEARQAAEERANAVTQQNDRMLAAAAKDLSPDLIDFIGGGTTEEITERTERLAGVIEAEVERRVKAALSENPQGGRRQRTGVRPSESLQGMRAGSAPASSAPMTSDQMFRQLVTGDSD